MYQNIFFESGVLVSSVLETGNTQSYIPAEDLTHDEIVEMHKNFRPAGGSEYVAFSIAGSEETHVLMKGDVERRFISEFHTTLNDLGIDGLGWIKATEYSISERGKKTAQQLESSMRQDFIAVVPHQNPFLQNLLLKNLTQDLTLCSSMGVAASIDENYAPFLHMQSGLQPAFGFAALEVILPNLSMLRWDKICKIRELDGLIEFRKKMIDLEITVIEAVHSGEIDEAKYEITMMQHFANELSRKLAEYQPTPMRAAADVALDICTSFLPGSSTALTAFRSAAELSRSEHS